MVPGRDPTVRYLCKHAGWTELHFLIAHVACGSCDAEDLSLACELYAMDSAYFEYYMEVLRERVMTAFELAEYLLMDGADPLRSSVPRHDMFCMGGTEPPHVISPLALAESELTPDNEIRILVKKASKWSTTSHNLFPAVLRDRALQLLLVAYRLASAEHFNNDALVEVFKTGIFPLLLVRPFGS